jgi:hypothetical protein
MSEQKYQSAIAQAWSDHQQRMRNGTLPHPSWVIYRADCSRLWAALWA